MLTLHPRRPEITVGETTRSLKLHRRRFEALIDGRRIRLTGQAWQLLGFLLKCPDRCLSNDQLCDRFRLDLEKEDCNLQILQMVCRARRVLEREGCPELIETVPGRGYKLRGVG